MAAPDGPTQRVATLGLDLLTTSGGLNVTPPKELATGMKGWQKDLQVLREGLEADARAELDSGSVSIGSLRFENLGAGGLTTVVSIDTSAQDGILVDRFVQGLLQLPARWCGSLELFLRHVTGEQALQVSLQRTYVKTEPPPAAPPAPKPTLTRTAQRRIRFVSAVGLGLMALFVASVIEVWPFGTWSENAVWLP